MDTNSKLQEIINFFQLESESWGKDDLLREYAYEIKELNNNALDEIGLEWDNKTLMVLDDFIEEYFNKVINGVCNAIESFKEEENSIDLNDEDAPYYEKRGNDIID